MVELEHAAEAIPVARKYCTRPEIAGSPGTVEIDGTGIGIATDGQMLRVEESQPVTSRPGICG